MKILRYLSIDVALGALACGVMVQWLLGVVMPPFWYVVLPACVWLIYTGDHLLDAKRLGKVTDSPRHSFHIQYYSQIQSAFFVILVVTGILAVIGLSTPLLFFGALAGGLVGLYFLIAHVFRLKAGAWFQKELVVAVLYALGIWGGPLAVKQGGLSVLELVLIFQLILLAFMNLLTLSIYEHEWDKKNGQLSMINQLGTENGTKRVYMIGFCVLVLSVLLGAQVNSRDLVVVITHGVMAAIFMWILKSQDRLKSNESYRTFGDLVFFLPLVPVVVDLWILKA